MRGNYCGAASIDVHVRETAAVQTLLHVPLSRQRVIPAHLQKVILHTGEKHMTTYEKTNNNNNK